MKLVALAIASITTLAIGGCGGTPPDVQKLFDPEDAGPDAADSGVGGDGGEGGGPCVPKGMAEACVGKECGPVWDGCSGAMDCGGCVLPQVCGGFGIPGKCGCTPLMKNVACTGRNCGAVSDACGGTYSCGTCTLPETCEGQTPPIAGVCGCTPKAPAAVCGSHTCGTAPDGCGGTLSCGTCTGNTVCGVVTADHCDMCPNDTAKLTQGQMCPGWAPVPRQCPSTKYIMPDCWVTAFVPGPTPPGQYCCKF